MIDILFAILLVALFFGGTIFVHELGHYLAAKKRGLKIDAFSIGFGPKLFGWTNRDGVEFKISALPLGGYVKLPQLAEIGLEGDAKEGEVPLEKLPPLSWADKVIVSVMGAVFNVFLAIALSFLLWGMGQHRGEHELTTTIGYIPAVLDLENRKTGEEYKAPSPAYESGLRAGDEILRIDGKSVKNWEDVTYRILLGTRRGVEGEPLVNLEVDRDGELLDFEVFPIRENFEGLRSIGIAPESTLIVARVHPDSPAEAFGLQEGDAVLEFENQPIRASVVDLLAMMEDRTGIPSLLKVERDGELIELTIIPARTLYNGKNQTMLGITATSRTVFIRENPIIQVERGFRRVSQTLASLVHPGSDVGLKHLSGPVGISYVFYIFRDDFTRILGFAILLNISLAILNLLPIPVLDGGHIVFATIQAIRGKPLPARLINFIQSLFVVLILILMVYIIFYDTRRVINNERDQRRNAPSEEEQNLQFNQEDFRPAPAE